MEVTVIRPERVERWLFRIAALGLLACTCGAVYAATVMTSWPAVRFLLLYVAPMCIAVPWWMRARLRTLNGEGNVESWRAGADAAMLVLAMARFVVGAVLPWSGHMLFLSYSAITTDTRDYRIVAVLLLVETTVFKLLVWQDARSWAIGLALGGLVGVVVKMRASARASR